MLIEVVVRLAGGLWKVERDDVRNAKSSQRGALFRWGVPADCLGAKTCP